MRSLLWLLAILAVAALLALFWLEPPTPARVSESPAPSASPSVAITVVSPSPSVDPLAPPAHLSPLEQELWRAHMALMPQDPWPPGYYNLREEGQQTYVLTVGQAGFGSFKLWAVWEKQDGKWKNRGQVVIGGEEAPSPKPSQYGELGLKGLSPSVQQGLLDRDSFHHISPIPDEP